MDNCFPGYLIQDCCTSFVAVLTYVSDVVVRRALRSSGRGELLVARQAVGPTSIGNNIFTRATSIQRMNLSYSYKIFKHGGYGIISKLEHRHLGQVIYFKYTKFIEQRAGMSQIKWMGNNWNCKIQDRSSTRQRRSFSVLDPSTTGLPPELRFLPPNNLADEGHWGWVAIHLQPNYRLPRKDVLTTVISHQQIAQKPKFV